MDSSRRETSTNLLRNATNRHSARAQPHLSPMGHGNQRRNETNHQRQNKNHQKRRRLPHPCPSQTQSNIPNQNKSNRLLLRKNQIQNQSTTEINLHMYAVIVCYSCGRLLLTKTDQKNRQCPHCGARLIVARTKQLALAKSAQDASRLIRAMKEKEKRNASS